tara:strand:- start:1364 stop:2515 length:1152 start_codon:yes stop_codon:yes gene_type:complete
MKIVLVDTNWKKFLPVSFTRPVSQLRCGILKVYEKWEKLLNANSVAVSEEYLNKKFFKEVEGSTLIINSKVLPNKNIIEAIQGLEDKEILTSEGTWLAIRSEDGFDQEKWKDAKPIVYSGDYSTLENWWDLYKQNGTEIENDFALITQGRNSKPLSSSNTLIGTSDKVFIEEGAYIEGCSLNTDFGSIYIGKNVEVMEGTSIRGGFSVLEESKIKLGAKIYGPTSIGPKCRIGGEVKNSIVQGYSNKSHDGYLGNSVIGEWVNLGAGTNCSNLKNTFSKAKVWSYDGEDMIDSGETFLGCCIGDFSKTGISTMLNTASVVGVNANVFGAGFQNKFIASFSWGVSETYTLEKAWEVNKNIAQMNGEELSDKDYLILQSIYSSNL